MLTRVDVVQGDGSETLVMSLPILGATTKSSLLIQKITGLNPPQANLFIGDYARDGGIYQGRRVGNRNPVLTVTLNPNPALGETIQSQREALYKAFMDPLVDADFIKLNLVDEDESVRYLIGYAEKFETEIFDSENMAQISVICPDPYIRANSETVLTNVPGWTTVPFTYDGTAETGFFVEIHVTATTPRIILDNNNKVMVIERPSVAGDIIRVNTTPGSRYVYYVDGSLVETSIIGYLTPTSPWLQLHSQANVMKVYGTTTSDLVASIQHLRYTSSYWGV